MADVDIHESLEINCGADVFGEVACTTRNSTTKWMEVSTGLEIIKDMELIRRDNVLKGFKVVTGIRAMASVKVFGGIEFLCLGRMSCRLRTVLRV